MRASEPLKSKRLVISLLACSTAFLTSCRSTWDTMSKEGIGSSLVSRSAIALGAARHRQVFHRRLAPHRLRTKGHQVDELIGNVAAHRQAKALRRFVSDRVVMRPGARREQAHELVSPFRWNLSASSSRTLSLTCAMAFSA